MPVLPIPMIVSLLLFGFLIQRMVARETHGTILALIAACAFQGAIIALVQYYGVMGLRPLQAVMATVIPPVAWAAFSMAAGGNVRPKIMAMHCIGPAIAIFCLLLQPFLLDILIPVSFLGYGFAMLLHLRRGEDSLLHSRLESGATSLLAWRIIAISLVASAACDIVIAYGLARGEPSLVQWIPSLVSSLSLLSLGILGLSNAAESRRENEPETGTVSDEDASRDLAIIARLDHHLSNHHPYLDPDLTLSRLSRKLMVPAKPLSTAINRVKGENVSRLINRHRIDHACALMAQGKTVTTAMLDSGFNTKSNFNREFLRLKSLSPSAWQIKQQAALHIAGATPISVIQAITESSAHD